MAPLERLNFEVDDLRAAFAYLDEHNFDLTQRLPLITSRQWSLSAEREAISRFKDGLSNVEEVGVPRYYWKRESEETQKLFKTLTLGLPNSEIAAIPELRPFFEGGDGTRPVWTVIARFGRYILRSHPEESGEHLVYFGDDTLFLMERARDLLGDLKGPVQLLDLCCGGGGVGLALPTFEGNLLGVDLNPLAIEVARIVSVAQSLTTYSYQCWDMKQGLEGEYDFIFGNPPTLSPSLTGRDVFHATGTLETFQEFLGPLLNALRPSGIALLTLFSQVNPEDEALASIQQTLAGRCGYRYAVRREFKLGSKGLLRHSVLELYPGQSNRADIELQGSPRVTLPALAWRRRP